MHAEADEVLASGAPQFLVDMLVLDQRLRQPEFAPAYGSERAAAIDLRACSVINDHEVIPLDDTGRWLGAGERLKIGSGLAVHLDSIRPDEHDLMSADPTFGLAGIILPRSGLGSTKGIVLSNLVGLIDPDYQGQIGITLWNTSYDAFFIKPMERLAQMVIVPVLRPRYHAVAQFREATARGAGGFGSTGTA